MPHDHDHHHHHHDDPFHHEGMSPSGHPYRPDNDQPLTYWQRMGIAVRELLVEKGITTAAEVNEQIGKMDARTPAQGARVVARAWTDPAFKQRLLADGSAAMEEMGVDPDGLKLVAVENTDKVHNVIVCTLCSCYPHNLLGLPPDWYKTRAYRSRTVKEPRAVLHEFGLDLLEDVRIQVHDSTADMRYMVLSRRPEGTEGWSREQLEAIVSRDCMIGVAVPRPG